MAIVSFGSESVGPGWPNTRSAKFAAGALLVFPLLQLAAEHFVALPIGPSRMLTIGLCAVALVPLSRVVLETSSRTRLSGAPRWATAVIVPLLAVAHLVVFARFADGPFGPVPGGAFSAAAVQGPADWLGIAPLRYLEIEVDPANPKTLETVFLVYEGGLYVAANMPEGKRWPRAVREHGEVRVRFGNDEIYALEARYVESVDRTRALRDAMNLKYGFDLSMGQAIWFFALEKR